MRLAVLAPAPAARDATWRPLLEAFAGRGNDVLVLEPGADDRPAPEGCARRAYRDLFELKSFAPEIAKADAVLVASGLDDGAVVGRWARRTATGAKVFYDVDAPATLAEIERGAPVRDEGADDYDLYLSDTGGPILSRLEQGVPARAARTLYRSVDTGAYRPCERPLKWDLGYIGGFDPERQAAVERLLIEPARRAPSRTFVIAGSGYPDAERWPANIERLEDVPAASRPAFYAACRFTLNAARADRAEAGFSPGAGLFEAAACGAAMIAEPWPGLSCLFAPGREIQTARTPDEGVRLLFWSSELERRRMADAARRKVVAHHSAERRAEQLEDLLHDACEGRARSAWAGLRAAV